MNIKLSFNITTPSFTAISKKEDNTTLELVLNGSVLTTSVYYSYDHRPLKLSANATVGDKVAVVLLDHRIELYVNDILVDEEWPTGKRLFLPSDTITSLTPIIIEEYSIPNNDTPSVISQFENAEGWQPEKNVFVGDCMPYTKNGEYHVLYLKDRHHHCSKWGLGAHQWEHISTKDLKTWYTHPMAVPITDQREGSICTGSWIKKDGTEYLYYTVRQCNDRPAPICRSTSKDGYHFTKDTAFGFTTSEKYNSTIARDPKVIKDENGIFHMLLTTSLKKENKGCLAHYVSKDMEAWIEQSEPLYVSSNEDHPECPDYFKYKGRYYLIFSLRGTAYYMVSENPFSDFKMPNDPIVPCESVPKCAEWNGKLVFTGFKRINGYAGTMTFKSATADENGTLIFEKL